MHRNYQSALAVWQTSSIQHNDTGFKFNFSTYKSLISSVLNKTRNRCKIELQVQVIRFLTFQALNISQFTSNLHIKIPSHLSWFFLDYYHPEQETLIAFHFNKPHYNFIFCFKRTIIRVQSNSNHHFSFSNTCRDPNI